MVEGPLTGSVAAASPGVASGTTVPEPFEDEITGAGWGCAAAPNMALASAGAGAGLAGVAARPAAGSVLRTKISVAARSGGNGGVGCCFGRMFLFFSSSRLFITSWVSKSGFVLRRGVWAGPGWWSEYKE